MTVLWITYAAAQFPTGALIDRVGERHLLVGAALLSGVGLLAYLWTPTFALFLLATAVFGLGTGLYGPTRGTVLSRTFDAREGVAFGTVLAAGSLGAAVLPAAAALVAVSYGWQVALAAAAPAFLLVAAALARTVPDRPGAGGDRSLAADLRGVRGALASRRLLIAVAGATLMLFAFQGVTAFLTTYLVRRGFTQATAGGVLSLLFVVGAVSQTGAGALADRFGTPRVLAAVALLSVPPLVALPLVEGRIALALVGAAVGVRMSVGPISNAYIVDVLPDAVEGTAWGALRTGFFAIGSFGSTLVGALAERGQFAAAFYFLALLTALAAACYLALPPRSA